MGRILPTSLAEVVAQSGTLVLVGWFSRKRRTDAGAAVSDRNASKADLAALREFATSRAGVEAFVEPPTSVTQTTVVMVAADGEWTRKRVRSTRDAAKLASELKIPLYDANRVGYPDRMRRYNAQKVKSRTTSTRQPTKPTWSRDQLNALMVLETYAGAEPMGDDPSPAAVAKLWKSARAKTHPDRNGGDRDAWDAVEKAARLLQLP